MAEGDDGSGGADPGRRRFLKIATCGIGGGIGLAITAPAVGILVDPAGRRVVTTSNEPIDVGEAQNLPRDGSPIKLAVIAPLVRDAWVTATNVALGSAWVWRAADDGKVRALSSICPHLGCAIAWRADKFVCPCHDSEFKPSGGRVSGPAERDLDPLDIVETADGRLSLKWVRFKPGGSTREPA
jgi:Rieske Fe-S protein